MAYDFSPVKIIRSVGFVSPKPTQNFTDDGNFFSVFYYQGDERLRFVRWTKGMQGGLSTPDTDGELLGFDHLGGSSSSENEILQALREDYPDLAKDYDRLSWTGSLGSGNSEDKFTKYMQDCALLGRRLQRYLDGKDPYGKDDDEIAQEHLKELWTSLKEAGERSSALSDYEFQLSRKDPHVAWFTGIGRGNWFTLTYDPVNKLVNVSKKRIGSVDIAEADEVNITANAVVDAVTEMIDTKKLGGSQKGLDPEKKNSREAETNSSTVSSDDGFIVEVIDSGGRLRVQGDDGVHGTAWVRFPNSLRSKVGQKYKVDQLKWNGKNYTTGGYINFVEDNGSFRKVGFIKLMEDTEDQWNKEALDIDKENTERVLAGLTGEDPLEEEKEGKKTLSNGIDVDRIMNQLKRLEGKKQLRDVTVTGPGVTQVSEPERVKRDHTNKSVKLSEDTETVIEADAKFSLPLSEAIEILSMLSSEQIEKLVVQFNLEDEDQDNIIDILTDYVDDDELEKIKEDPEGYLAIETETNGGEEPLEEEVKEKSLREVLLSTEDVKSSQPEDLAEEEQDPSFALLEAIHQYWTKTKALIEETRAADPETALSGSDEEVLSEDGNDIDIIDTEDKVVLDMTTEEGKQEAFGVLVDLIPDDGITVEVEDDDGSVESFELTKKALDEVDPEAEGEEDPEGEADPEEPLEEDKDENVSSTLSDLASETGLTIDDKGKVTSGQPVKTIKAKVAKFNKAHKSEFNVNYDSETDSIIIS